MPTTIDLVQSRDGDGSIRVVTISHFNASMDSLLRDLGLQPKPEALEEVSEEIARRCVSSLLKASLAYKSVTYMDESSASEFAQDFLAQHAPKDARFYVNGRWDTYRDSSTFAWTDLATATFDGVVLAVGMYAASCIVVEEQD